MSESAQVALAVVIRTAVGLAITCVAYAVLSTFLWAWLAAMLALIASCFIERTAPVKVAEVMAFNLAVPAAEKAAGWLASFRAKVQP